MDIKCERCGTEYEFDDGRVTEEGVTVKCSTCGHLFKVRKKSFVLTEPVPQDALPGDDQAERNWMVRRPDGSVLSFKELTTLQKWIVERRVSRDDEISKSGETWKRLGSIAELASFFQVVDQATAASMPAIQLPPVQPSFTQPLPAAQPALASPPVTLPGLPALQPPPSQPASPVAAPPQPAPPARPLGAAEPDSWGDGSFGPTEDDVVEKWKKRGRRKWFLIVPLMLIAAGAGAFYLLSPARFMGLIDQLLGQAEPELPALARTQFESGRRHFLRDSDAGLQSAIRDLDSAVKEAKGRYPEAMGWLAEAYIARAERHDLSSRGVQAEIADLDAKIAELSGPAGKPPAAKAPEQVAELQNLKIAKQKEYNKLMALAKKDMDEAKRQVDAAREVDPKSFEAKLALANYLRVNGAERAQIEVPLKEAEALRKDDPGLLFVDGAAFAADPASLDTAVQKLARAIELQEKAGLPDLLRARYVLARALIDLKRPDDAQVQLERILKHSADHAPALALLASLAPPPPEPPPEPDKPEPPSQPAQPTSYDGWMGQADRLQQAGRSAPALRAYEEALALKPGDVEAMTGRGLCLLDLGNNAGAVAAFQQALKINASYGDAIIGLAEAYKYKRDNANATKYYKRYLEVLPNGPEASVARSNLEQLK